MQRALGCDRGGRGDPPHLWEPFGVLLKTVRVWPMSFPDEQVEQLTSHFTPAVQTLGAAAYWPTRAGHFFAGGPDRAVAADEAEPEHT